MSAGLAAGGLKLLGRMLFGGGLRTAATVGGAGYVAHQVTDGASTEAITGAAKEHVIDPVTEAVGGQIDDSIADMIYDYIFGPLGVSREKFDDIWEQVDPAKMGLTIGAAVAGDKALDAVGLDIVSTKTVAFAAAAFHMTNQLGLVDKVKGYLVDNGYAPDHIMDALEVENKDFNVAARGEDPAGQESDSDQAPQQDEPTVTQSQDLPALRR